MQERSEAEKHAEKQSRIRYVKELADTNDAWITPVDAARITGVSESMANRWIASGRLSIKGDPETQQPELVGTPPRTRQVRVSDVAKLHIILYPEQSISPVVRTLDVTSIPLEVARLTQEHQQIAADHLQILERLTKLLETVARYQEQFHQAMQQQSDDLIRLIRDQGETLTRQQQGAEGRFTQAQHALRSDLSQAQKSLEAIDLRQRGDVEALQTKQGELAGKLEA